ncbi:hypothetical protein PO909_018038 [Leuciscus waleckii]
MRLTLRALISHGQVARRMGLGPESRINMLRYILSGLVRHKRIETQEPKPMKFAFTLKRQVGGDVLATLCNVP